MRTRRATVLLWGAAAILFVGGALALRTEWKRAALPENGVIASRIMASMRDRGEEEFRPGLWLAAATWDFFGRESGVPSRVTVHGWEFRLCGSFPQPKYTLCFREGVESVPYHAFYPGGPNLLAAPVTPMANLRYWLGAYRDGWVPADR